MKNMSINEVFEIYIADRVIHFDNGGEPTRHVANIKSALRQVLKELPGAMVSDLDGPTLAEIRDRWIKETQLARNTINRRVQYAQRMIKWCVERGFVKSEQLVSVMCVELIAPGRRRAQDKPRVQSAPEDAIDPVLEELPDAVRSMMEMIRLTGMRPGEVRLMQLCDLKRMTHDDRPVFKYTPSKHKTAHLGKSRRVFLAGRAFDIAIERISSLAGETLFDPETEGYLFSPDGKGQRPYAESSVPQAVRRARLRAVAEKWTPNQLRHGFATKQRREGEQLELIADLLGHSKTDTTLIYIDREVLDETDDQQALEAAIRLAQAS